MAREVFEFNPPERIVVGTVGEPGQRAFFLQARYGRRLISVAIEKQQVSILARRLEELLSEILRRDGAITNIPEEPTENDTEPLESPIEAEFRVGTISLAWDPQQRCVVIECFSLADSNDELLTDTEDLEDEDEAASGWVLRVWLPGPMARNFAHRSMAVVAAGRPPCPICAEPLDTSGHICPRENGYRRG